MKDLLMKKRDLLNNHLSFFLIAVLLFWLKTYAAYQNEFDLGISNSLQEFLLFINPISSAILFLGIALFAKGKKPYVLMVVMHLVLSIILYVNIGYYRFFTDFITLPTLMQGKNFGDLGGSAIELLKVQDIFYFSDTIVLIALLVFTFKKLKPVNFSYSQKLSVVLAATLIFSMNLSLAEKDRPELLTRTFDRNYIVKYLGLYNYMIYDAIKSTKSSTQRAFADGDDMAIVLNNVKSSYTKPNPTYFGKAEGKNVIYLHLESIQEFLIDYKLQDQEVMPFLNSITKHPNTLYFDNFFHQTSQGKTADAEFMVENSLYGLPQGAVFTLKGNNTYQAAPAILGQKGYTSAVFHGNSKTFWNRNEIYKSFGYDRFYDDSYYELTEETTANYGLKDKPFFEQSIDTLASLPQPFYTKFITVSHHFPYDIEEEEATIGPATTGDASVDRYFQTARYADEALQAFFEDLKARGLYENSIIVMYGDHYGISENHNKALTKLFGTKVGKFEQAQLQRVPLIIHTPGLQGGVQHQYGGQIDLMPTLMHLLGIDTKKYVQLGSDLLSPEHDQIVAFRNGNFVTPTVTSIGEKYYNTTTGEKVEKTKEIEQYAEKVKNELQLSDKIVYEDLLRFYTPEGFKPVDIDKYNYNKHKFIKKPKEVEPVEGAATTENVENTENQTDTEVQKETLAQ